MSKAKDILELAGKGGIRSFTSRDVPRLLKEYKVKGLQGAEDYILVKFTRAIIAGKDPQKAWEDACEDENYYGDKPEIVKVRKGLARLIQGEWGMKVDPSKP